LAKPLSRRFVLLQSTLLYLPLCILVALTLVSELFHDEARTFFLVLLTALVGLLLTTRYLLATYDNELLLRERERQRQETEQLYQQLQSAYQRLQELDQLKDQFMMTASHELRTPLTSLQGYLELLAEHADRFPPERRWDFLQKAQQSCDEVVLLLRNVIDATRLEMEAGLQPVHLERVVIQDIVQSVMTLIGPQVAQEQREVHIHVPSQLAVQADPERLRQVLLNLSVNALKYSPPGTPLTFSAQAIADKVRISVTDKGRGIPPEDQSRLFQRFVRLERDIKSPIRGSGLGLYISRRLIEAMGGEIWIESTGREGEGATFHIELFVSIPLAG
jgi:signal transduction histidine kinase